MRCSPDYIPCIITPLVGILNKKVRPGAHENLCRFFPFQGRIKGYWLPDGRVICKYPKGTNSDKPNSTKTYFGRGPEAEDAAWAKNNEYGLGIRKTVSGTTFLSLVNAYLDAKEEDLANSTYDKMVVRMEGTILPNIGREQAHKLTKE